jgi:hypothetical protein
MRACTMVSISYRTRLLATECMKGDAHGIPFASHLARGLTKVPARRPGPAAQGHRFTDNRCSWLLGSPMSPYSCRRDRGYVPRSKPKVWQREPLRLVKAHDHGKVSDYVIADRLARLNYEARQCSGAIVTTPPLMKRSGHVGHSLRLA